MGNGAHGAQREARGGEARARASVNLVRAQDRATTTAECAHDAPARLLASSASCVLAYGTINVSLLAYTTSGAPSIWTVAPVQVNTATFSPDKEMRWPTATSVPKICRGACACV